MLNFYSYISKTSHIIFCFLFNEQLKKLQSSGELMAFYSYIPSPFRFKHRTEKTDTNLTKMGRNPGMPSYLFYWDNGYGFIELLSSKESLSSIQFQFKKQCEDKNIRYAFAKSVGEALEILYNWGVIKKHKVNENLKVDK